MQSLLRKYNLGRPQALAHSVSAQELAAAERQSLPFYSVPIFTTGTSTFVKRKYRRDIKSLIVLSEAAIPSRAISFYRKGITKLEYGIKHKVKEAKIDQKKVALITSVLENPNPTDLDFRSFLGQVIEDILVYDAGCFEYVSKPSYGTQNKILGLEVVPGCTIAPNTKWSGDPNMPRWGQMSGQEVKVFMMDRDLEYIMMRKRAGMPSGLSPLEVVIDLMEGWLNLISYQKNVASEAYPNILVYLGDKIDDAKAEKFRLMWRQTLTGRGEPGFFGGTGQDVKTIELKPPGDEGLYLKYQEVLTRIVAFVFDLKPMDFGVERDVNRSTAEVTNQASIEEALEPLAEAIAIRVSRRIIPRIAEEVGDADLLNYEFFYPSLNKKDEKKIADIHAIYLDKDVLLLDEVRAEINQPPMERGLGKMTLSQYREYIKIASVYPEGVEVPEETPPEPEAIPPGVTPTESGEQNVLPSMKELMDMLLNPESSVTPPSGE
jgi:hypothetical protein